MGFVNEVVKSDTAFPSGGVGRSGYGRECGTEGYKQFANIKVHYINWFYYLKFSLFLFNAVLFFAILFKLSKHALWK